jgi:dolichol-phosphate mannosyltransferase
MKEQHRMFRGLVNWLGTVNTTTIPFVAPARLHGVSKYRFKESLRLASDSIMQFSIKPLRFATYTGFIAAFLSLTLGAFTIWEHFAYDKPTTGYATIVSTIIFIGAVQLIALGIIGEYIGRIHLEVRERPLYFAECLTHEDVKDRDLS